jgi:hypothetical protein
MDESAAGKEMWEEAEALGCACCGSCTVVIAAPAASRLLSFFSGCRWGKDALLIL